MILKYESYNTVIKAQNESDEQIKSMKAKYDEDIALLKDAVIEMQTLLKNPQKLVELIANPMFLDSLIHSLNNFLRFFSQKIFQILNSRGSKISFTMLIPCLAILMPGIGR